MISSYRDFSASAIRVIKSMDNQDTITPNAIIKMYLSYVNDYLTVSKFASDHNLSVSQAQRIIDTGRAMNDLLSDIAHSK